MRTRPARPKPTPASRSTATFVGTLLLRHSAPILVGFTGDEPGREQAQQQRKPLHDRQQLLGAGETSFLKPVPGAPGTR